MKGLFFLLAAFLFSGIALADIPAFSIPGYIRIEIDQNYPEYQFYLCSYEIKSIKTPKPNANKLKDISGGKFAYNYTFEKVPDTFQMRKIDLTPENPITEPITGSRIETIGGWSAPSKVLFLVAVKKEKADESEKKLKNLFNNLAVLKDKTSDTDGIRILRLEDSLKHSFGSGKDMIAVNKIFFYENNLARKIDESRVIKKTESGIKEKSQMPNEVYEDKSTSDKYYYVAAGLFLTGIIISAGLLLWKRNS